MSLLSGGAQKRYGKALFELTKETGEDLTNVLHAMAASIKTSDDAVSFLQNPLIVRDDKAKFLHAILAETGSNSTLLKNFLSLIAEKGRAEIFVEMVEWFDSYAKEDAGIVEATVVASGELSQKQKESIESFIKQKTTGAKEVVLNEQIDEKLIAGFKVLIGSVEYDASMLGRMDALRTALKV